MSGRFIVIVLDGFGIGAMEDAGRVRFIFAQLGASGAYECLWTGKPPYEIPQGGRLWQGGA